MLIMLIHGFEKVAKTREMLVMLIILGKSRETTKRINIINISLVLATFFFQKVAKTSEMLIMLIHCFEKVAKTREVLITLIMLIFWGKSSETTKRIDITNISLV